MSNPRKIQASRAARRLALAAMLISATGCASGQASLSSLNPFAGSGSADPAAGPASGGTNSPVSSFVQGTRNQASSMGMAVKSAYSKGRDSLAGVLGSKETTTQTDSSEKLAANDPLLLQNRPASIGPEVFVANGQLWESTGNFERAMENYSKALEKHPDNPAALASIARLNVRQERYEPAVDYFQRAIAADPAEAALYHDLGLALSKLDRHEEAVTAAGKALAVAPGSSRYANSLASVMFAAGREQEARAALLKHNKPAVAHYNMAYLYYSSQRTDLALQELRQVLALEPQADTDSASQQAVTRAKELFAKLEGPAAQIAQAVPQMYGAAQNSAAAVAEASADAAGIAAQVRDTASGVTVQLSSGVSADPPKQLTAQSTPATSPLTPQNPPDVNQFSDPAAKASPAKPSAAPHTPGAPTKAGAKPSSEPTAATAPTSAPASGSLFQLPPEFQAPSSK